MVDSLYWIKQLLPPTVSVPHFMRSTCGKEVHSAILGGGTLRALPRWSAVNVFLETHRNDFPRVRLEREGSSRDELEIFTFQQMRRGNNVARLLPHKLYGHLRDGATLVIDAIDEAIPVLRDLRDSLKSVFKCHVQINAYCTFGASRGFGLHWDDHDVFIIQLEGRKEWNFYGMTRESPLFRDIEEAVVPSEKKEQRILERGDVIYIPRGYWHDVVGVNEPSLHLTIGVNRPSGINFLSWVSDRAREGTFFREDLPIVEGERKQRYREDLFRNLNVVCPEDPVDVFWDEWAASDVVLPRVSLPYGASRESKTLHDCSIARVYALAIVERVSGELRIRTMGKEWVFDERVEPLFGALNEGRPLSIKEGFERCKKEGLDIEYPEWLEFVDELIFQNLVYVYEKNGE